MDRVVAALLLALAFSSARQSFASTCHWDSSAASCTFSDDYATPILLGASTKPIDRYLQDWFAAHHGCHHHQAQDVCEADVLHYCEWDGVGCNSDFILKTTDVTTCGPSSAQPSCQWLQGLMHLDRQCGATTSREGCEGDISCVFAAGSEKEEARCFVGNLGYLVAAEQIGSSKAPQLLAQEVLCRKHGSKAECEASSETAPELVHAGAEATV